MARLGDRLAWAGGRAELDVRRGIEVQRLVADLRPDAVVNATAYNKVDAAEGDPEEALAVNAAGPLHLALAARECGALLVHVSTDYVFDGRATEPYREEDVPRPLNVYGVSKRAGEMGVAASGASHILVRTSGVFGAGGSRDKGGSFVDRILARARSGDRLRVVADERFSPTYAPDLAAGIVALLDAGARGVFHLTNSGACTWHELARAALEIAGLGDVPVEAITSGVLALPAERPEYSVLSNERYCSLGLPPLRHWRDALVDHLRA